MLKPYTLKVAATMLLVGASFLPFHTLAQTARTAFFEKQSDCKFIQKYSHPGMS